MFKQGPEAQPVRVLVIDDDEIALEAIREVLKAAGYEPHCLSSPIGATQVIVSQGIEAVVVDLNMPVMSGDRFISLLRSWDRIRTLPAILISESTQNKLDDVAGALSSVQTVTKSNMRQALPQALQRALAKERLQASFQRGTSVSTPADERAIASRTQVCINLLSAMGVGRAQNWPPLLSELRLLRDQVRTGAPHLLKLVDRAIDTAESCARRQMLSPEARLAFRGMLELIGSPELFPTAKLQSLQAVQYARLQRAGEEFDK